MIPREYTLGDMGIGECAGEIVTPLEFQLTACEREAFEAQLALEKTTLMARRRLPMAQCNMGRQRYWLGEGRFS